MITFKTIEYKNFLSTGNVANKIDLNTHKTTLLVGLNGNGKCVDKFTEIDIKIEDDEVMELFNNFTYIPT
jgi:hypothetical protein